MSHLISLLLFIIITTLILPPSSSTSSQIITGKIAVGSSITASPNATSWLSPSGDFAFGFQPLRNNNTNINLFVLAIWFAKIPDQTIVWFDRQLAPLGSILTLEAQNGLVLHNSTNKNESSPYVYTVGLAAARVAYAYMNDTGNLVLSGNDDDDDSSTPLWQSFENPSDTILPTQTIGLLPHQQLISKNGESDFSYGRFYAGMSNDGRNFVLSTKSVPSNFDFDDEYYNSDTPSGYQLVLDQASSVSVVDKNGQQVKTILQMSTSSSNHTDYYFRATLEFDGVFTLYYHPKNKELVNGNSEWVASGTLPGNICKEIDGQKGSGACGYNNVCRLEGLRPVCNCPEGFELVDPSNRYGDCKSNFTEKYGGGEYGLVVVRDVDWPFNDYEQRNRSSWEECKNACYEDYFCGAAIFRSDSCWKKRMPLSNGRVDKSLNATAFLKVRR